MVKRLEDMNYKEHTRFVQLEKERLRGDIMAVCEGEQRGADLFFLMSGDRIQGAA